MSTETPTFTEVFFHSINGGSMYKQAANISKLSTGPILCAKRASPFRIIPLDRANKPLLAHCCEKLSSKSDYYDLLSSQQWSTVAIQNEDGQYLSCSKMPIISGALAEYRSEIGDFEKFEVEYNTTTKTFSFKSHNDLFLHYNHYIQTIAFKERDKDATGWIISPIKLHDWSRDLIRFVGVVSSDGNFLMQKNYVLGSKPAWHSHLMLHGIVKKLEGEMSLSSSIENAKEVGCCTILKDEDVENTWFVTKSKEGVLNIVITSVECPPYIGTLCVEEVEKIFTKHHALERGKLLDALLIELANRYEFSVNGIVKDKIKRDSEKMNDNFLKLQENTEHAQDLFSRYEELKVLGRKLYHRLFQLPGDRWSKGAKKTPDVLAKSVSNLACSFAESKLGNSILGANAEVVVDATSNFEMEKNGPIFKFCSRRFISFGIDIGDVEIDYIDGGGTPEETILEAIEERLGDTPEETVEETLEETTATEENKKMQTTFEHDEETVEETVEETAEEVNEETAEETTATGETKKVKMMKDVPPSQCKPESEQRDDDTMVSVPQIPSSMSPPPQPPVSQQESLRDID